MLARLIPQRAERGNNLDSTFVSVPGGFGFTSAAYGNAGNIEDALKNAASWACLRVLMDALGRTPITAVREVRGKRVPVEPVPKILARPSGIVAVDIWRSQLAFSVCTDGNVFGQVAQEDNYGRPEQIELLDAEKVTNRRTEKGIPTVDVNHVSHQLWPWGDIWHTPGDMVKPGTPYGISPLQYANKVIGTSLSAEDFAYGFFNDGGHPPIALVSAQEMDEKKAADYKRNWQRATRATREPVVMGNGIEIKELHLDPSETQFIELMKFCVEQACRFWGVPPAMIFAAVSGQNVTYSNVAQADLHYLKHSLEGRFVRLEHAFTELLPGNSWTAPSVPNTLAVVDRDAVLKADAQTRYTAQKLALEARFKTINEVRKENDDPPFEGDEFDQPNLPPFRPTPDVAGVDPAHPAAPPTGVSSKPPTQ